MAMIMNVEKPYYINKNIELYTKAKIGQYSKFLEKNPIFVTYYHINEAMSREDVGTGSIESELGERSPIRFNKITNFPMYNIPELKPDINYDETGYDIELECTDIVILPNTIKPKAGDYFIISFPGIKEFLFRVNNFRYNSIQSNDYYMIDADIKDIGQSLELNRMKGQIVEEYLTVFDNIGTQDRCFVKTSDIEYLNGLGDLFYKLRDFYKNAFYVRNLNTFTFMTGRWSETGLPIWRYDAYLEKFINDSNIYYDENSEETLVLSPAAVLDPRFDFTFDQTLYQAVLKNNTEMLRPYCYIVTSVISQKYSIFNIEGYFGENTSLFCYKKPLDKSKVTGTTINCPTCTIPSKPPGVGNMEDKINANPQWYDLNPMPKCTPTWDLSDGLEYFPHRFLSALLGKCIDTDEYFELIIFNYLHNISMKIDRAEIIDQLEINEKCFYYLPMIIYIISSWYRGYFKSENEF